MDKNKNLVKSKSSNSAITTKSDNTRKKSRSSAEFQQRNSKKRGVYVEKKSTKLSLNGENKKLSKSPSPMRPPPRPRDTKRFVASVLTILSKRTTSTQYPDPSERRERENRVRARKQKLADAREKRPKYKSKVLNSQLENDNAVIVFKGRKELVNTPSVNSQKSYKEMTEMTKYMNLPQLVNYDETATAGSEVKINSIKTESGKARTALNKLYVEEPTTLVSETKKKEDKGMYNFFVDLLETTFDVYNIEPKKYPLETIDTHSKITFEIDENVAKKLEIQKEEQKSAMEDYDMMFPKNYSVRDIEAEKREENEAQTRRRPRNSSPVSSKAKSGNRSPSKSFYLKKMRYFEYAEQYKVNSPKTSVILPKRNRTKKKTLLNLFKEQLQVDDEVYEPQNLYEALKIMARNKRRYKKLQFEEKPRQFNLEAPYSECMKRRKVISSSSQSKRKKRRPRDNSTMKTFNTFSLGGFTDSLTDISGYGKKFTETNISEIEDVQTDSIHSIEVTDYDYVAPVKNRHKSRQKKDIVYAYSEYSGQERPGNDSEVLHKFADQAATSLHMSKADFKDYRSLSEIFQMQSFPQ